MTLCILIVACETLRTSSLLFSPPCWFADPLQKKKQSSQDPYCLFAMRQLSKSFSVCWELVGALVSRGRDRNDRGVLMRKLKPMIVYLNNSQPDLPSEDWLSVRLLYGQLLCQCRQVVEHLSIWTAP